MNVLHLVAGELSGGAAKGAYCLHIGLLREGVDSQMLTTSKKTDGTASIKSISKTEIEKIMTVLRSKLDCLPMRLYSKKEKTLFSSGFLGYDFTDTDEYKRADIIHLHWVNSGLVNVKHLRKIKKPIVWTMRDMWPMTGGCHYSMNCEKYVEGCNSCPQLGSTSRYDLSSYIASRKKKYIPKSAKIVGISKWISDQARKSDVFSGFDIRTISNNIDTKEFFRIDSNVAKSILGLSTNKKILLLGSQSVSDFYKGFSKALDTLNYLDADEYFVCFFGEVSHEIEKKITFEYKSLGFIHDIITLRLVYSVADVFIAPSIMEAFGKTIAEAMACGVPVVCFDATGPKDIVDHKENGYKATPFDVKDLAYGIEWVAKHSDWIGLSCNARNKSVSCFDNSVISKKYIELYKAALEDVMIHQI